MSSSSAADASCGSRFLSSDHSPAAVSGPRAARNDGDGDESAPALASSVAAAALASSALAESKCTARLIHDAVWPTRARSFDAAAYAAA